MKLRGIEFGTVIGASGVDGWFGEGYAYHKLLRLVPGFTKKGITLTSKTTTLLPRKGNMPLAKNGYTPRDLKPDCVVVEPGAGVVLNAVGLSGPGTEFLLRLNKWQKIRRAFFISFMSVGATRPERMEELKKFCEILKKELPRFSAPIGLQINFSCPNTGHDQEELAGEIEEGLGIAAMLDVPLVPKISVLIPPDIAAKFAVNPNCDAIAVSNSIPWADVPENVRKMFFHTTKSPLEKFGGGAVSGKYLLPLVAEWITQMRRHGMRRPIIAGGGILKPSDVTKLVEAGATAVSPGTVVMLRPWNMRGIVKRANRLLNPQTGAKKS